MAAPLNTCTTIEQRGVVRFLWAKIMDAAKDIHKEMLPIWAAFLCGYPYTLSSDFVHRLSSNFSKESRLFVSQPYFSHQTRKTPNLVDPLYGGMTE
jgi:hypothetical protein